MLTESIAMRAVRALITAAALTLAFTAGAQTAPADSLTRALATFWGTSLRPVNFSADEKAAFMNGVYAALSDTSSVSSAYSQGINLGLNFASGLNEMESLGLKVDRQAFAQAILSVLKGENIGFTAKSAGDFIDSQIAPLTGARDKAAFTPESQAAFVAQAAGKEGAVTTASGLVLQVITEGEGEFPSDNDRVELEYIGRLSDGSIFDETEQPVNFDLVRLVPGFSEGLKLMRPGGEYRIVFPAALGYGERGVGDVIPPGAALDFTVKLLSVDRGSATQVISKESEK